MHHHELNRTFLINAVRGALKEGAPYVSAVLKTINSAREEAEWFASGLPQLPDELFRDPSDDSSRKQNRRFRHRGRSRRGGDYGPGSSPERRRQLLNEILGHLDAPPPPLPADAAEAGEDPDHRPIRLLAECLGVNHDCVRVLELCHASEAIELVCELWGDFKPLRDHVRKTALFLAMPEARAERALNTLSELGVLNIGDADEDPDDWTVLGVDALWSPPVTDLDDLRQRLVGERQEALLGLEDFGHVEECAEALAVLRGALERRAAGESPAPGVNILLFGRAGTGKTELARTLAAEAGGQLYSIGEVGAGPTGTRGGVRTRKGGRGIERRNELRFAGAVLGRQPKAIVLCDEMEAILDPGGDRQLEVHRLLERAPVPTIFTANKIGHLSEAVLRRFLVVVRFRPLGPPVRRRVVARILGESGIELDDRADVARKLADELECSFGIVASAIRSARLVGGRDDAVIRSAERIERTISTHIALPRIGAPVPARLPWSAFDHLGADGEDARALLRSAIRRRESGDPLSAPGVNLLFYGPPGTGKTEFSRTLASEAGAVLYAVGGDGAGSDTRRTLPRDQALEYAIEALRHEPRAVILFDEMEDFGRGRSKEWLNRLMERSPVPILWTVNATDSFRFCRPFSLDRMVHSLHFGRLRGNHRREVFASLLDEAGLPEAEATDLADAFARTQGMTPRQVRLAARHGRSGGAATIRRLALQKARLRLGAMPFRRSPPRTYDPALARADRDLIELASALRRDPSRGAGLLFSGPPGAGKTAFARYLARHIEKDCLVRRASDLLDKYVGESEKQIAQAFDEARSRDAVLVLDEADSLLSDRRNAHRSWEVSQVNELLSQMERHPLPFLCTTNLADSLDPASVRRFLIHVRFGYLDRERIARGFRLFFGEPAPREVLSLRQLTPADFDLVRKQAELLTFADNSRRIAAALQSVCAGKVRRPVAGFRVAPDTRAEVGQPVAASA